MRWQNLLPFDVISCVTWCWHRGLWLIRHQYHRMVNVKELDFFVMICVCIVTVIFCMYLWYFTKRWVSLQNRRNILPRIKQYKYIGFLWSFLFAPKEVRWSSKFPSDPPHILKNELFSYKLILSKDRMSFFVNLKI